MNRTEGSNAFDLTCSFSVVGFMVVVLASWVVGQTVDVRDTSMPNVYLSFENQRQSNSGTRGKRDSLFIFRIHNNLSVPINVAANFDNRSSGEIEDGSYQMPDGRLGTFLKSGAEVELCFDAEGLFVPQGNTTHKKAKAPANESLKDSCDFRVNGKQRADPFERGYWIRPGEYVRFAVPSKIIKANTKLFTDFSYPWEFRDGIMRLNEPRHRVYFFYYDLPVELLP
ncbi:MAG: hypothetical protein IPM21_03550 [Acidobacteria bacterium]|nr:hypothetical protein [Acidobacteriota bacterium]